MGTSCSTAKRREKRNKVNVFVTKFKALENNKVRAEQLPTSTKTSEALVTESVKTTSAEMETQNENKDEQILQTNENSCEDKRKTITHNVEDKEDTNESNKTVVENSTQDEICVDDAPASSSKSHSALENAEEQSFSAEIKTQNENKDEQNLQTNGNPSEVKEKRITDNVEEAENTNEHNKTVVENSTQEEICVDDTPPSTSNTHSALENTEEQSSTAEIETQDENKDEQILENNENPCENQNKTDTDNVEESKDTPNETNKTSVENTPQDEICEDHTPVSTSNIDSALQNKEEQLSSVEMKTQEENKDEPILQSNQIPSSKEKTNTDNVGETEDTTNETNETVVENTRQNKICVDDTPASTSNTDSALENKENTQHNFANEIKQPVEILDLEKYFDDFDPDQLNISKESVEFITKIHERAQLFEEKIQNYRGTNYSVEYFVLDENLMRLLETLDKVKCKENEELLKEKIKTIDYINELHKNLDKNATN